MITEKVCIILLVLDRLRLVEDHLLDKKFLIFPFFFLHIFYNEDLANIIALSPPSCVILLKVTIYILFVLNLQIAVLHKNKKRYLLKKRKNYALVIFFLPRATK